MTSPAVSVLMPVLNPHPVYFPEAVASIVRQTFTDWELVIVEDPSPSSAAELLKPFADPRIRLITNPQRSGLRSQLNQGLRECRGGFVARMDADDIAIPTRLAVQHAVMLSDPLLAVLGCQLSIIDATGAEVGFRRYPTTHDDIMRCMPSYNALPHPGVMARRAALERAGGYAAASPVEDYDLWSRMLLAGERFANSPEALLCYRVHPANASKGDRIRNVLRQTLAIKRQHWWRRMSWLDRTRYRAEQSFLWLPASWVYCFFCATQFDRNLGARPKLG